MSLMSTLGKVAVGIMVAKGVGRAMGGSGNIGDLVGGLLGGKGKGTAQQDGGLGSLLGSLTGGSSQNQQGSTTSNSNNLGDLLSAAFAGKEVNSTPDEEKQAEIILKAMINAAKADGVIDEKEQQQITKHLGDISAEELEFVKKELNSPLDLDGVINSVPDSMAQQVYLMSLLTIDLDSKSEAEYMDKLAQGLNISKEAVNSIHQKAGVANLYS